MWRTGKPLAEFAGRWGWAEIETDWRQIVLRDDVTFVDIAAPPNVHHKIALEAVKAGKHVFCEKPIALTVEKAREVHEAANAADAVPYVNHICRRCPAVTLAKQLIDWDERVGQEGVLAYSPGQLLPGSPQCSQGHQQARATGRAVLPR
jgi:predicted dehydrogenase